jgi:predicted Rossmann fold nucleotide-binding protein DprA/Smf involved in DNA uptake
MSKVLICGNRTWTDWEPIYEYVRALSEDTIVVQGGARGADHIAAALAQDFALEVRTYPANWKKFGKRAGVLRNAEMLEKEHPDLVVAFTRNLATSKGTRDMVERARRAGIPVEVRP